MIRSLTSLAFVAAFGLNGTPALAQWSGGISAGLVNASGNSKSSSATTALDIARAAGPWTHNLATELYRADSEGEEQADRLTIAYKLKRDVGAAWYAWTSAAYTKDQFASIDRRLTAALGVGKHLLDGPKHLLDVEAGLGWRQTRLTGAQETDAEAIVRLAVDYKARLNESSGFTQRLSVESGSDNTLVESRTGLKVMMSRSLSLVLAYSIQHNSDIVGRRGSKTDALTTVNVAYDF